MKITNKSAYYNYTVEETFEAGINLLGAEVKAIRLGHADLTASYIRILGSEAYLINAKIFPYKYARPESYDQHRSRKLLLHKKQIIALKSRMDGEKLTVIPLSLYTTKTFIKAELALAKGKKQFQKKEAKKRQDLDRELEREINEK